LPPPPRTPGTARDGLPRARDGAPHGRPRIRSPRRGGAHRAAARRWLRCGDTVRPRPDPLGHRPRPPGRGRRRRAARRGRDRRRPHGRRIRHLRRGGGNGAAAVPASLPRMERGLTFPRIVRGGTGHGLRDRRQPRPAPRHDRRRQRRLHGEHPHGDGVHEESHGHHSRTGRRRRVGRDRRKDCAMTITPDQVTADVTGHEPTTDEERIASIGQYNYGWHDSDDAGAAAQRGLSEAVVRDISSKKNETDWMLDKRLKALRIFDKKPMPKWGSDLSEIDFDNIKYFVRATEQQATSREDLPEDIKNTYDTLGIPEAEKQRLVAGVAAQYESEVVYHQIREDLESQGVIFMDTDTALKEHP